MKCLSDPPPSPPFLQRPSPQSMPHYVPRFPLFRLDKTSGTPFSSDVICADPTRLISFRPRKTTHAVAALITLFDLKRPLAPQAKAIALSPNGNTTDVSHPLTTAMMRPKSNPMYSARIW